MLFWLENAGWRGVLGAAAVFWEGEAGEEPDGERGGKEEDGDELGGAARDGFVCSFLISSSMETARTSGSRVRNCLMANCCTLCGVERNFA